MVNSRARSILFLFLVVHSHHALRERRWRGKHSRSFAAAAAAAAAVKRHQCLITLSLLLSLLTRLNPSTLLHCAITPHKLQFYLQWTFTFSVTNCNSLHNLGLVNKDDYIWYFVNVNTPVPSVNYCDGLDRCILYCILFVFMLALLRFCVVAEFSVNKDLYLQYSSAFQSRYKGHIDCIFSTNALLLSPSHAGGVCSFVSGITQKRIRYVFSFISEGS